MFKFSQEPTGVDATRLNEICDETGPVQSNSKIHISFCQNERLRLRFLGEFAQFFSMF